MSVKKDRRFKVVVRKLPIRDYSEADFEESVSKACNQLQCSKDDMFAAHFVPGKMSRKRYGITYKTYGKYILSIIL